MRRVRKTVMQFSAKSHDVLERRQSEGPPASSLPRNTPTEETRLLTYPARFSLAAARFASRTAVKFGNEQISYAELNVRANQLAHFLITLGAGPEALVPVMIDRSVEQMLSLLAVWKAGAAFLPIDPAYPKNRREFMLRDSGAQLLLASRRCAREFAMEGLKPVWIDDPATQTHLSDMPAEAPHVALQPENLAYVIYTSGSTGNPKGVEVPHRAILNHNQAIVSAYGLVPEDRILQFGTISFDLAFEEIFPAWLAGATLVLRTPESTQSLAAFLTFVEQEGITVLDLPTAFWHELTEHLASASLPRTVRLVAIGGETASGEVYKRWKRAVSPEVKLINTYGPTETTVSATLFVEDRSRDDLPIGRPLPNVTVYVLNERLQPVPVGEPGELFIGGAGLARGYRNLPEQTAAAFIPNPATNAADERIYRTGDLVCFNRNGDLEFVGRRDDQVKIRGFRIELGEVESALRVCPGVKDVAVVAREDRPGRKRLVAYWVPSRGSSQGLTDMVQFLKNKLPAYMVPAAFVRLDQLPLSPSGKVDRRSLPVPGAERPRLEQDYVEPRTATEQKLASIFQEVLAIGLVGTRDDFFELGGDSLTALQVVSRITDAFDLDFPVSAIFEKPCIEALALRIDSESHDQAHLTMPPLVPVPRTRPLPVSFVQERLWFLYELDPASDAYNMPAAIRIRGSLNVNALERALNELVARHESLHTSYEFRDELVQIVAPPVWMPLRVDLATEAQLPRILSEATRVPFDLASGPLLKTRLFRLNEQDHALLVVMHHSIWDGWSLGIFFKELETFYRAAAAGELKPDLPPLPVQYGDYAFWQRRWMQGPLLEKHLWFWKNHLSGAPAKVQLPSPASRLPRVGAPAARCCSTVDEKLVARVTAFAHRNRVTPFMVLLTGLAITLQKWTAQKDLVVGTVVAGRPRRELEDLIGCFINFLPLRINVGGIDTAEGVLRAVRQTVIEAQSHQDCPFEKIVSAVNPRRVQGGNPLYNVALLWHQFPTNGGFGGPGLKVTPLPVNQGAALLDLRLEAEAHERKWIVQCEYNTGVVDQKTAQEVLATLIRSVDLLVRAPQSNLSEFAYGKGGGGNWFRRLFS